MGVSRGVALGVVVGLLLGGPSCRRDKGEEGRAALRVYSRASIDLRGVRPSYGEAQIVLGSPEALPERIDALADDGRLGQQVANLYAPTWGTRVDESDVQRLNLGMPDEVTFLASVGEEPLRILRAVVDADLPWTDVVRAEWSMADDVLAERFPVDYPAGATGWQQVRYTDGRPLAGVLSSSGMWWRYSSTFNNANRGRVNALSRIFLCKDYLSEQVAFPDDLDLTDEAAVRDAVRTNPACLTCHEDMDPIGAYLWGFYSEFDNDPVDWAYYHPDREHFWEEFGVAPAYFGTPGTDLDDLGRALASDPRFIDCVVRRSYGGLLQQEPGAADADALARHREAFLAGGVTLRALFRSLAQDTRYQDVDGEGAVAKLMTADTLASVVEDLTGYRFVSEGHDAFDQDYLGLRSMAGGGRSGSVNVPVPTPAMLEVHERLAQGGAAYVVTHDLASPGSARLLDRIGAADTPDSDPEAFAAQVQALYLRILGQDVAADSPEVEASTGLWSEVYALDGDPAAAWQAVVATLLRDPSFLVY